MIGHYWFEFRYWLAGKIVGLNIIGEIDAAYEAGREYGRTERWGYSPEKVHCRCGTPYHSECSIHAPTV